MYNLAKTRKSIVYINSKDLLHLQRRMVVHNLLTVGCWFPNGVLLIIKQFDCDHSATELKAMHINRRWIFFFLSMVKQYKCKHWNSPGWYKAHITLGKDSPYATLMCREKLSAAMLHSSLLSGEYIRQEGKAPCLVKNPLILFPLKYTTPLVYTALGIF